MANIQPLIRVELDPRRPVQEICNVILAVLPYHPGNEELILRGVQQAIDQRLKKGGEAAHDEPVREHQRNGEDQAQL